MNVAAQHARADRDALTGSLARVSRLQRRVELRDNLPGASEQPSGQSSRESERWVRCVELLTDPALLERWLHATGEWLRDEYGEGPAPTAASYLMSWYLRVPAYVGALLLHHERRVPMLRPEELAIRIADDGRPHPCGIAVLGRSFYCLPVDPGSARPEATAVADERVLATMLRTRYVAHAARFIQSYGKVSPFGARTLWAGATDALDTCLWWAGLDGGDESSGVADAALVLDTRYPPLTSTSTLRPTSAFGDTSHAWSRQRESCCFTYLLPSQGECTACPRRRGSTPTNPNVTSPADVFPGQPS